MKPKMSLFRSGRVQNIVLAVMTASLPLCEAHGQILLGKSESNGDQKTFISSQIEPDGEILTLFDRTCGAIKNFDRLKVEIENSGWSSIPVRSQKKLTYAAALGSVNGLKSEKSIAHEYVAEFSNHKIFVHIERIEYVGNRFANRCGIYDFDQKTSISSTRLKIWQGREADRGLDRGEYAKARTWLQVPNGAPKISYIFRKTFSGEDDSLIPNGIYIQTEFSGLRQKV